MGMYIGGGYLSLSREILTYNRAFIETVMNFMGVSLTLYAAGHLYMFVFHNKIIKPTIRCPYCKQYISEAVSDARFLGVGLANELTRPFVAAIVQRGKMEGRMSRRAMQVYARSWLMPKFVRSGRLLRNSRFCCFNIVRTRVTLDFQNEVPDLEGLKSFLALSFI